MTTPGEPEVEASLRVVVETAVASETLEVLHIAFESSQPSLTSIYDHTCPIVSG